MEEDGACNPGAAEVVPSTHGWEYCEQRLKAVANGAGIRILWKEGMQYCGFTDFHTCWRNIPVLVPMLSYLAMNEGGYDLQEM